MTIYNELNTYNIEKSWDLPNIKKMNVKTNAVLFMYKTKKKRKLNMVAAINETAE